MKLRMHRGDMPVIRPARCRWCRPATVSPSKAVKRLALEGPLEDAVAAVDHGEVAHRLGRSAPATDRAPNGPSRAARRRSAYRPSGPCHRTCRAACPGRSTSSLARRIGGIEQGQRRPAACSLRPNLASAMCQTWSMPLPPCRRPASGVLGIGVERLALQRPLLRAVVAGHHRPVAEGSRGRRCGESRYPMPWRSRRCRPTCQPCRHPCR